MPHNFGSGKKRKIQSGRNFVFTQAQQRQFDSMLQKQRMRHLTARGKRIRARAKEIVDLCILETKKDMRDNHKWTQERHANEFTKRVQHEVVKRIPLPKEEKKLFTEVINFDNKFNNFFDLVKSGKQFNAKEVADIFKRSRQIYYGLGPELQRQFPKKLGETLEGAINHFQTSPEPSVAFNEAFFDVLRSINSARITKEHGVEYTIFISELSTHILKRT